MKISNKQWHCSALAGFSAWLGVAATGSQARAAYVENLKEVGSDVVATGSGTINTAALGLAGFGPEQGYLDPSQSFAVVGGPTGGTSADNIYDATLTGPSSFGSGGGIDATTSSGDIVGLFYSSVANDSNVDVPQGYVSGASLSSTSTFAGETLSSLGITPGTYTWTWGATGAGADSFTLKATVVPEPASLSLLALAIPSLLGRRRRVDCRR